MAACSMALRCIHSPAWRAAYVMDKYKCANCYAQMIPSSGAQAEQNET
jgi:hypothetical protein